MRISSNMLEGAAIDLAVYIYSIYSNSSLNLQWDTFKDILDNLAPKLFLIIGNAGTDDPLAIATVDPISIIDIKDYIRIMWKKTQPFASAIIRRLHMEIQVNSDISKDLPIILSNIYVSFLSEDEIKLFKKKVTKICNLFDFPANVIVSSIGKNSLKYKRDKRVLEIDTSEYIDMFGLKYVKLAPERVSYKVEHIYKEAMLRILPTASIESRSVLPFYVWSTIREYLDFLVFEDIAIKTITNEVHDIKHPVLMNSIITWRSLYKFLLLRWLGFDVNDILVSTSQGGYDEDV